MHEVNKDEPLARIQELGAHNRKISAINSLPAQAQAHRNCNFIASWLYLRPCSGVAKSRTKIEDSDEFCGDLSQVHATKDLPNLTESLGYIQLRHIPLRQNFHGKSHNSTLVPPRSSSNNLPNSGSIKTQDYDGKFARQRTSIWQDT